jgi:P pilus assembly chaperone PapD
MIMMRKFQIQQWMVCIVMGALSVFMITDTAQAQLQFSPSALYMDDNQRTERMSVRNTATEPLEVTVDMVFGHPATNKDGGVYLKRYETVPDDMPSALAWIRAYPRHFILQPGERQTIRFAARPPAGLADGEYWARPVITSFPAQAEQEGASGMTARINLRTRNILSINYRSGQVRTGVRLTRLEAGHTENRIRIEADMARTGNAAYIGHIRKTITDMSGNEVYSNRRQLAVYTTQDRVFEVDARDFPPGRYTVSVELFTGERTADAILQAPAVRGRSDVMVR